MKELWDDFKKWVHYIFNYKSNTIYLEIKEQESKTFNEEIERLKKVIDNRNETIKLKDALINELMDRIGNASNRIRQLRKKETTNERKN